MTVTVNVDLGERSYDVEIGLGLLDRAGDLIAPLLNRREVWIIADATAPVGSDLARTMATRKRSHRPDLQGGHGYIDSQRHANYVDVDVYLKTLSELRDEPDLESVNP